MFLDEGWKEINWGEINSKLRSGVKSYVPVLEWLPKYDRAFLKTDAWPA